MAEVWLALQEGPAGFAKQVVVKTILPHLAEDQSFVEMFLNEARLAALLNHPNLVQIFELGEEAGTYFLVMEYIEGRNLRSVLRRARSMQKPIPLPLVARIATGVCEGLQYAHEARDMEGRPLNLVHRDISPENVLVSFDGQPKVVDFGIAKAAVGRATRSGALKGKLGYMPPEQIAGEPITRRADIYALGVLLYELISGKPPFSGESEPVLLRAVLEDAPTPLGELCPDAPLQLVDVVERAMARNPEDRFQDARAMAQALEGYLRIATHTGTSDLASFMSELFGAEREGSHPSAYIVGTPSRPAPGPSNQDATRAIRIRMVPSSEISAAPPPPRRRRALPWVGGAVAAVGLVAASAWLMGGEPVREPPKEDGPAAVLSPREDPATERRPEEAQAEVASTTTPPTMPPVEPTPTPVKEPEQAPAQAQVPTPAPEPSQVQRAQRESVRRRARSVKQEKGRIVLHVLPWAEVSMNGETLGTTPLAPIEVNAGKHMLHLVNYQLKKTRSIQVDVRGGEDTLVKLDLMQ